MSVAQKCMRQISFSPSVQARYNSQSKWIYVFVSSTPWTISFMHSVWSGGLVEALWLSWQCCGMLGHVSETLRTLSCLSALPPLKFPQQAPVSSCSFYKYFTMPRSRLNSVHDPGWLGYPCHHIHILYSVHASWSSVDFAGLGVSVLNLFIYLVWMESVLLYSWRNVQGTEGVSVGVPHTYAVHLFQ